MKPRAAAAKESRSRNRWLVLGLAATAALAALVVLSLTGVLDRGDTRRDVVAAFIDDVNATQRGLAIERQRVSRVYARARTDPRGLARSLADLDRSAATLRLSEVRISALEPPTEAAELHRRLVALSRAEAVFAAEIARLGRYLPALAIERRAVGAAGVTLRDGLAASTDRLAQAAAFDLFADEVETARRAFERAPVPTTLKPVKAEELNRAANLTRSGRALATSLRAGADTDTAALVQRFGAAAVGGGNALERQAVIAFDAQARRVDALRLAATQERARLDRELR